MLLLNLSQYRSRSNTDQKQPSLGVLRKRCSANMQQTYRRTPMPKCEFNKVACNFAEITLHHGCFLVHLLHIFKIPFPKNTSGRLLLGDFNFLVYTCCKVYLKIMQNIEVYWEYWEVYWEISKYTGNFSDILQIF